MADEAAAAAEAQENLTQTTTLTDIMYTSIINLKPKTQTIIVTAAVALGAPTIYVI